MKLADTNHDTPTPGVEIIGSMLKIAQAGSSTSVYLRAADIVGIFHAFEQGSTAPVIGSAGVFMRGIPAPMLLQANPQTVAQAIRIVELRQVQVIEALKSNCGHN